MEAREVESRERPRVTRMSRFVELLVRIHFLPVVVARDGQSATFSLWSLRGLASLSIYYISCILLFLLASVFFSFTLSDQHAQTIVSMNLTDLLSNVGYQLSTFFTVPALPLILGKAASLAPRIALSPALTWPRRGRQVILCEVICAIGYALGYLTSYLHFASDNLTSPYAILFFLSLGPASFILGFCVLSGQLLLASWLDRIGDMVEQDLSPTLLADNLNKCLKEYQNLDSALGFFFLFNFTVHQFTWIFCLYCSLTGLIHSDPETVERLYGGPELLGLQSLGMLLLSCCLCWHLLHMTSGVEQLRERFRQRGQAVLEAGPGLEGGRLVRVGQQLTRVDHLTALGYFPISRATLRGMASAAVTYLIILIQFKSGNPVTPK